jgi:hypothetical protein
MTTRIKHLLLILSRNPLLPLKNKVNTMLRHLFLQSGVSVLVSSEVFAASSSTWDR